MARLEDLRKAFAPLSWGEKLEFVKEYRAKRYTDLTAIIEFDLSKKTKSTKAREPKAAKAPRQKKLKLDTTGLSTEQLELLAKLGYKG